LSKRLSKTGFLKGEAGGAGSAAAVAPSLSSALESPLSSSSDSADYWVFSALKFSGSASMLFSSELLTRGAAVTATPAPGSSAED